MNDASNDFVCPSCYDRSCFSTTCARCLRVQMIPATAMPSHIAPRVKPTPEAAAVRLDASARIESPLLLGLFGALMMLLVAGLAVARVALRADDAMWFGYVVLILALKLGVLLRPFYRFSFWRSQCRVAKLYQEVPRTNIAGSRDGIVRVAGVGQLLFPHPTPRGIPSLAYRTGELTSVGARGYRPADMMTDAGCIVIADGSGTNALVNTPWVEIIGRARFDGSILISPGALIEVAGCARRVAVPDAMNGGMRTAPDVLEFVGSEQEPVVIRVIDPKEISVVAPTPPAANESTAATPHSSIPAPHPSTGIRVSTAAAVAQGMESTVERASIPSMHRSVRV